MRIIDWSSDVCSSDLFSRIQFSPSADTATEDWLEGRARESPRRARREASLLLFHCGKPPPAAAPSTRTCSTAPSTGSSKGPLPGKATGMGKFPPRRGLGRGRKEKGRAPRRSLSGGRPGPYRDPPRGRSEAHT